MKIAEPEYRMVIDGELVPSVSGAVFLDHDPARGEVLAELPSASREDVDQAVRSASAALVEWSAIGGRERGRILARFADELENRRAELARLESQDNGRPIRETSAQGEILHKWFRYFAGLADKLEGKTIPVDGPYLNYTTRVPIGVCVAITPWNHPQLIVAKKIAPALAAGNCVVVKPSSLAPLSVIELGKIALQAGLPPGVLNVVTGTGEAGAALSQHEAVGRVDVTGSTATGIAVAQAAAASMKRLGFELGGKAANLVFEDSDFDRTVRGAAFSGFIAQGQSCVAGSRALVAQRRAREFAEALAEYAKRIRLGDPLDQSTQMGPLISPAEASRVQGMVRAAVDRGAQVLAGGTHPEELESGLVRENYLLPTVIWTDDPSIEIACEEVFGPVIVVIPFRDEEDAVTIANSVQYGLGAAVWSNDVAQAHRVASRLRAGITWINDYHRIDPASPWGGFGVSGYGRENGIDALDMFTETKSVWVPLQQDPLDWYESKEARRLN